MCRHIRNQRRVARYYKELLKVCMRDDHAGGVHQRMTTDGIRLPEWNVYDDGHGVRGVMHKPEQCYRAGGDAQEPQQIFRRAERQRPRVQDFAQRLQIDALVMTDTDEEEPAALFFTKKKILRVCAGHGR